MTSPRHLITAGAQVEHPRPRGRPVKSPSPRHDLRWPRQVSCRACGVSPTMPTCPTPISTPQVEALELIVQASIGVGALLLNQQIWHHRTSEGRLPGPIARRCMAALPVVISARQTRLAGCLSRRRGRVMLPARVRRTAQSVPVGRSLALSNPSASLLTGKHFFYAGYGHGAQEVAGPRCKTSRSRRSSTFWASSGKRG